jgi:hypothetical protein
MAEATSFQRTGVPYGGESVIPFAAGFRFANGDPGATGSSYAPALTSASGTADWRLYAPPMQRASPALTETELSGIGSIDLFRNYQIVVVAPTSASPEVEYEEPYAEQSRFDIEREVAVILPPKREYTLALRARYAGRASLLIDRDDFVEESDAG